jgi:hypothetical protein
MKEWWLVDLILSFFYISTQVLYLPSVLCDYLRRFVGHEFLSISFHSFLEFFLHEASCEFLSWSILGTVHCSWSRGYCILPETGGGVPIVRDCEEKILCVAMDGFIRRNLLNIRHGRRSHSPGLPSFPSAS